MSRLIVNADDLGYTCGINRAIQELYEQKALSSATAMATGDCIAEAAAIGPAARPKTGGHIIFVDGIPVSAPERVPTLLVEGRFRATLGTFLTALLRGHIRAEELQEEAIAQIQQLQTLGFLITHLDTHKHTHMFARVLGPLLGAAAHCGVGAVRNPFEPAWARRATAAAPRLRRLQVAALSLSRLGFLQAVSRAGLRTTAGSLGVLATGVLNEAVIEALLGALARHGGAEETWELVCHPGFRDEALDTLPTRLRAERVREHAALLRAIPHWTQRPDSPHTLVSFANL